MAEDEDRWFAVVKVVMHLQTPLQARNIQVVRKRLYLFQKNK
jgi:hypothetical protein